MSTAEAAAHSAANMLIVGIERAEMLLGTVRADRQAAMVAGVLGPGGCGKSALLSALRLEYQTAGVPVLDAEDLLNGPVPARSAVLIDDAHRLQPDVLQAVTESVGRTGGSMIVAFRPWPRPPALTTLASALRRYGPLTVLRQLGRQEVARRAGAALTEQLSPAWIDLLTEQTGGQPLVLDETVATLREVGCSPGKPSLPAELVDRLRYLVDEQDGDDRLLLHAVAAGASVETGVLSALLELDPVRVREAVERVRAGGFLLSDGRLIPLFRAALLDAEHVEKTRDLQLRLLDIHAGLGHDVVPVARALATSGIRNHRAAAVLTAAADLRLATEPAIAAVLFADAVRAGAAPAELAVRRAQAAVSVGRFDEAIQLADPVLADPQSPDLAKAIDVIATVLAQRGQLGRAAELYRWLGPTRVGTAAPTAALAMLATGAPAEAAEFRTSSATQQCPTMVAGAMALIAEGIELSFTDSYPSAISALSRATALIDSVGQVSLVLDSPAALTALVALHAGEFDLAESVLRRALTQGAGGALARRRLQLLLAWTAMARGQHVEARKLLNEAVPPGCIVEQRDEILAAAMEVGLARRAGNQAALAASWHAAREVILRQPVDLFILLPLGELALGAAAVDDLHLLDTHLKQAWVLLAGLGDPDLWSSPLHWSCVQADVLTGAVDEIDRHCRALDQGSPHNTYGRALASAAHAWFGLLTDAGANDEVAAAATRLQNFGLTHEAGSLATGASARCVNARSSPQLLQLAKGTDRTADVAVASIPVPPAAAEQVPVPSPRPARRPAASPGAVLSGREVQVAVLLLRNQTYREIGERLFISPKTVEHHVARMKQRIGASRRSELFAQLRVLTDSWDVG